MSVMKLRNRVLTQGVVAACNRLHYTRRKTIERVKPLTVSRPIDAQAWRVGERARIR